MMRTDSKGRSASPHRITYKSDFHSIKCSFNACTILQQETKGAAAAPNAHCTNRPTSMSDPIMCHTSTGSTGRLHSTRGTKIRDNIFLKMDSNHLRQDGGSQLSTGSTPAFSPQNPGLQLHFSPFACSRRLILSSSSSVLSTVADNSASECSVQEKATKGDEMMNIDRAALAQKFSVTRRLFEAKGMEIGGLFKPVTGRGGKGRTDGKVGEEENEERKEEEPGVSRKQDCFDKEKSISLPVINFSLTKPPAFTTMKSHRSSPELHDHGETPADNSSRSYLDNYCETSGNQAEERGPGSTNLDLCLTPEPVRAELVHVNTESSESDGNEEEIEQKKVTKSQMDEQEEGVEMLVDDVFEDSDLEPATGHCMLERTEESTASEEHWRLLPTSVLCQEQTEGGGDSREDKYEQVAEQWEGEREERKVEYISQAWKTSTDNVYTDVDDAAGNEGSGLMEGEGKSIGKVNDEGRSDRKDDTGCDTKDKTEAAEIFDKEKEDSVWDQCPAESSTPPKPDSVKAGSLDYEEIPGIPVQDDEDGSGMRKVTFSNAPIKVRYFEC